MTEDLSRNLLQDRQVVRVHLPLRGGGALYLQGAVKLLTRSSVEIIFPGEALSGQRLDDQAEVLITWEKGDNVLSARARLDSPTTESRLRFELTGFFFHTSERRFPRVDAELYLKYWATGREEKEGPAVRQKVNISGCGIRFLSDQAYAIGERVALELSLPGPTLEIVRCIGCVVWERKMDGQKHEIALDIVQVPQQELEKILNFCLVERFKQLHSKVRVMGPVLSPMLERLSTEPDTPDGDATV